MVLPRTSFLRSGLRFAGVRPNATRTAGRQTYRQTARRGYAEAHGHGQQKKGSDLPWAIGSVALTVPAAGWLLSTGPKTSEHHITPPPAGEEQEEPSPEKKGREGDLEKTREEQDDDEEEEPPVKDETDEEQPKQDSEDKDDSEKESDNKAAQVTPDVPSDEKSGAGTQSGNEVVKQKDKEVASAGGQQSDQKGDKSKLNFKRESNDPNSGAQHPYLDSDEKSKKGEGVKDTAKLHGTVDSDRPLR